MQTNFRNNGMVLEVEGRICGYSSNDFLRSVSYWSQALKKGKVLLDLSKVDSIDSMGLEALAKAAAFKNVVLCNLSEELFEMLRSSKYSEEVRYYRTCEEAAEEFKIRLAPPISATEERRSNQRVSVCAPTKFNIRSGDQHMAFRGVVTNLSVSGALVEYLNKFNDSGSFAFAIGMPINDLELFNTKKGLNVDGALARLSSDHCQMGLGVRFADLSEDERERIAEYIKDSSSTNLKIERISLNVN
ncbi:MAG: STAS domain-containing protein [Candidatus Aureabacteria bacterium]|nr:STAS domain-containing protein [Candidatus Auribacterota bacterium]